MISSPINNLDTHFTTLEKIGRAKVSISSPKSLSSFTSSVLHAQRHLRPMSITNVIPSNYGVKRGNPCNVTPEWQNIMQRHIRHACFDERMVLGTRRALTKLR